MKILLVGSFVACQGAEEASGTVISLRYLRDDLQSDPNIEINTLDTGLIRRSSRSKFVGVFQVIREFWSAASKSEVIALHLSPGGFSVIGPIAWFIARLKRKPILFRMFGGLDYRELDFPLRNLAHFAVMRMDSVLAQSEELYHLFKARKIKNVVHFPTSRPMPPESAPNPHCRNANSYLFVAQIKRAKGIFELIEAFRRLGDRYKLDVYGPFYDNLSAEIFEGLGNVSYNGVLPHDEVSDRMRTSKALVFPTYLDAEGYSGVILEAFGCGLPVICSRWKYLPELVDETCGILIEPKNVDAIACAVRRFDADANLQLRLSDGAFRRRVDYSTDAAKMKFLDACNLVSLR